MENERNPINEISQVKTKRKKRIKKLTLRFGYFNVIFTIYTKLIGLKMIIRIFSHRRAKRKRKRGKKGAIDNEHIPKSNDFRVMDFLCVIKQTVEIFRHTRLVDGF